jgi:hypothetical protein
MPPSRPLSNPSDKPPRPLANHPCLCPVVAFGSTPSSQPLANPYVPPCLDTSHLVLEFPLRNLRGPSHTLFTWMLATSSWSCLRHHRGLSQNLFTWRLATLSWSCLCATSVAPVKYSLPGGWPPCPAWSCLRHHRGLSQTLFTWRLATLSELPLRHASAASVKPSLPGCWPPCPGVASAPPPQPQSNPLYLEAGHLVLELPLRNLCGLYPSFQEFLAKLVSALGSGCLQGRCVPMSRLPASRLHVKKFSL